MTQLQIPALADGETYVGCIGDAEGNAHHIILLPGDNDDATWGAQMEWAKSIGGDLPTRVELAMLWACHRDQFKTDLYWSNETYNETYNRSKEYAWYQVFFDGSQNHDYKSFETRARAVRRLPI